MLKAVNLSKIKINLLLRANEKIFLKLTRAKDWELSKKDRAKKMRKIVSQLRASMDLQIIILLVNRRLLPLPKRL